MEKCLLCSRKSTNPLSVSSDDAIVINVRQKSASNINAGECPRCAQIFMAEVCNAEDTICSLNGIFLYNILMIKVL